jgi:hypothetical protein
MLNQLILHDKRAGEAPLPVAHTGSAPIHLA